MAEVLVEIVLEQFVSIFRQQVEQGISLIAGAEQEVGKLQSNFLSIQAVLADAENRQVKENAVRVWLDKLKDVSYDINDVLDEWNTKLQKLKIKKAEDASNPLKKGHPLNSQNATIVINPQAIPLLTVFKLQQPGNPALETSCERSAKYSAPLQF